MPLLATVELIARVVFAAVAAAAFIAAGFFVHLAAGFAAVAVVNGYAVYLLAPDDDAVAS